MKKLTNYLGLCLMIAVLVPRQLSAQPATGGGITLPGSTVPPAGSQTCVQVEIAGQKPSAYNCLNQQLQQQVQGSAASQPNLPLTAESSSNQVGIFNEQGVRQQYGQNFGKSAIPYRPPAPVFGSGLQP